MRRIMVVVVASVLSVFLMVLLPRVAEAQGKVQAVGTDPFSSYLSVLPSVGVQGAPEWVAITPDGTRAYVTNEGSNSVSVIQLSDNTVLATITDGIGGNPEKIAIRPDGKRAYTTNETTDDISVIDTNPLDPPSFYNHVIANLAGFTSPEGIAINPCGDRAVVTDEVANLTTTFGADDHLTTAGRDYWTVYAGVVVGPIPLRHQQGEAAECGISGCVKN